MKGEDLGALLTCNVYLMSPHNTIFQALPLCIHTLEVIKYWRQ